MKIASLIAALATLSFSPADAGNVNIIDGDTIRVDGVTIRIMELDTPETFRSRCENELVLGLAAKQHLRALIDSGPLTYEVSGQDRYGRTLAKVFVGDVNIGQRMISDGVALPYQPGKDAKLSRLRHWCGPNAELDDRWTR